MASLTNWMAYIKDDRRLNQLVFPATHDSGMSWQTAMWNNLNPLKHVSNGILGVISFIDEGVRSDGKVALTHNNFTTQSQNIAGQLASGARQLDLRMTKHGGKYRAYHGAAGLAVIGQRRYGEYWQTICSAIGLFMANNSTEFLILKMDKQSKDEFKLMTILSDALKDAQYDFNNPHAINKKYLEHVKVKRLRGRVLVCVSSKLLRDWRQKAQNADLHESMMFCQWQKFEDLSYALQKQTADDATTQLENNGAPIYRLVGSAEGTTGDKFMNVIDKQASMKEWFYNCSKRIGMRGIWFNTYSAFRDIGRYSEVIWANKARLNRLWLTDDRIQNVASVDFLDDAKGKYIVGHNPKMNWTNDTRPDDFNYL